MWAMSFILMADVWRLELTPTQQHVLMAMADYADDDGRNCFPSHRRLAWKTGYTTKTIANMINGFIESGLIVVLRLGTNKQPPRYQLCLDMGAIKAPYGGEKDEIGGEPVSPQDGLGRTTFASGGERRSAWGERRSPDPIINQSTNQPGNEIGPLPEKATEKVPEPTEAETAQKWAQCREELGVGHRMMGAWLQGSELLPPAGRMQDGKPLYRLLVVNPGSAQWLRHQADHAIRATLRGVLGRPVAFEIISELPEHRS
jgi:hypothetical protein